MKLKGGRSVGENIESCAARMAFKVDQDIDLVATDALRALCGGKGI